MNIKTVLDMNIKTVFSEENYVPNTVFIGLWPRKLGQGQQNLINFLLICHNDTIHKVWPEPIIQFKRKQVKTQFGSKFDISKCWCNLENKVKATKI